MKTTIDLTAHAPKLNKKAPKFIESRGLEIVKSPKLVNGSSAGTTRSAAVQKRKAVETES